MIFNKLFSRSPKPVTVERVTVTKVDRKPKPSLNDNLHCKLAKEVEELRKVGAL